MFVVRVIPIARGVFRDSLTFFSKEPLGSGIVVDIIVRGRKVPALVLDSRDVREEKALLRKESYVLKKLSARGGRRVFPQSAIEAVKDTARHHAVPDGVALAHFSPSAIVKLGAHLGETTYAEKRDIAIEKLALQAEYGERVHAYRNLAREAFARGASLLILVPTVPEAESLEKKLERGIEGRVVVLSSAMTPKATRDGWNRAGATQGPILMIVTHQFLTIPRKDLGTIVIERESARSYVGRDRAHLDARIMAEARAARGGMRLIFADFPLRAETRARLMAHELEEAGRLQVSIRGANVRIVDARAAKDEKKKKPFSPLTDYAQNAIAREIARGGRVAVYAARRGISPVTVCNDCGTPVLDPATGAPMTLHKTSSGNVFLSYRSGAILPAETTCATCGSWNLISLGIGVERVAAEIEKLFPDAPRYMLTAESTPTHTNAKKIRSQFFSSAGGIMTGTDRMLPYLEPVELAVVTSADAMLSAPGWRAEEHALHTLFALRDTTEGELIIQTRVPEMGVIRAIASGNPTEFFERELRERATHGYPPFVTFIGLTWEGSVAHIAKIGDTVRAALPGRDIVGPLPARAIGKNRYQARAVIRLPKGSWPDDLLIAILKTLPPDIGISVDPDGIV